MKRHGMILGLAALFLVISCRVTDTADGESPGVAQPRPLDTTSPVAKAIAAKIAKYQQEIEQLRGLEFRRPVTSAVISRSEYQHMTATEIDRSLTDSLSRNISRELAQFGFFPDTSMQYKELFKSFEGGFAVGFYVGGSDTVFVLSDYADNEDQLLHILPHELAHALQDQYGRLDRPRLSDSTLFYYSSDVNWFHTALVEGEAAFMDALVTATFTYPQPDPIANAVQVSRDNKHKALANWRLASRPENLFLPNIAPYQFGPDRIAEGYVTQGWAGIDSLYANSLQPSAATINAHVYGLPLLDFDRFFKMVDTTQAYVDQGCHGSIGLLSWLNQTLDSVAFFGGLEWRGDRYAYVLKPGQPWGAFLWAGIFTDSMAASRIVKDLGWMLSERFQGSKYPKDSIQQTGLIADLTGLRMRNESLETYLVQNKNEVYLVEGVSRNQADTLLQTLKTQQSQHQALTRRTTLQQKTPWISGKGRFYQNHLDQWRLH
jgi:hypothetical protein